MIYLLGLILIALVLIGYICYHYLRKLVEAVGNPVPVTIEQPQPVEPVDVKKESSFMVDTELIVLQRIETELLRVGELRP